MHIVPIFIFYFFFIIIFLFFYFFFIFMHFIHIFAMVTLKKTNQKFERGGTGKNGEFLQLFQNAVSPCSYSNY